VIVLLTTTTVDTGGHSPARTSRAGQAGEPAAGHLFAHLGAHGGDFRVRTGLGRTAARVTGSLSMRTRPSSSPASFWRRISDRRRCRSMATYCRCTGPLLRERVGLVTSSLVLDRLPAGEDPASFDMRPAIGLRGQAGIEAFLRLVQQERGSALSCHHVGALRGRLSGVIYRLRIYKVIPENAETFHQRSGTSARRRDRRPRVRCARSVRP
jgi:hypothetical protein